MPPKPQKAKQRRAHEIDLEWKLEVMATGYQKKFHRKGRHPKWFEIMMFINRIDRIRNHPDSEILELYEKHVQEIEKRAKRAGRPHSFFISYRDLKPIERYGPNKAIWVM